MSVSVPPKVALLSAASHAVLQPRRKRRRSCSTCRTYVRKWAMHCGYCGKRSLTHWHVLFLFLLILFLSYLLLTGLSAIGT
jgi:hypothetical protein